MFKTLSILFSQFVLISALVSGCDTGDTPSQFVPLPEEEPAYRELSEDEIPPCLRYPPYPLEFVIRGQSDYDSLRTRHAPQGNYEEFTANGTQTRFALTYQPLDFDGDNEINENEVIIYMSGIPIFVLYQGSYLKVSSYPFYVIDDSLLIFKDTPPYTVQTRIPCSIVFNVDPVSGAVNFVRPPSAGNQLDICGSKRLYDSYDGRTCSMVYFDFDSSSIIGKRVLASPPDCVRGIEMEVLRNDSLKQVIYRYKPTFDQNAECGEQVTSVFSWIAVDRIPDDYSVVFEEIE